MQQHKTATAINSAIFRLHIITHKKILHISAVITNSTGILNAEKRNTPKRNDVQIILSKLPFMSKMYLLKIKKS